MNACDDKTIKDLLPAYRDRNLDLAELERVRVHLQSCEDCRTDLALLGLLASDSVPDPGEAFWKAMPGRVHRAVRQEMERKGRAGLSRILDRFILPRWAWTAAAVGAVLLVSWIAFLVPQKSPDRPPSPGYDVSEDIMAADSSAADPAQISALDRDELDTAAAWAGNELASISRELDLSMVNGADTDLYEELRQLNAGEVERLSTMIEQWSQEV